VLSEQNIRNIMLDLAKFRNDGLISESDLQMYGYVIGKNLVVHPEMIEDAIILHKTYSAMPPKGAKKAASGGKQRKTDEDDGK